MEMFLVRRNLPAVGEAAWRDAVERCHAHAEDLARAGHLIRYRGCAYVAADGFCGCLYEASSADLVRLATERAAVPYQAIIPLVLPGSAQRPAGTQTTGVHL